MTLLIDLPDELLGDIVERIHFTSAGTLPSLALACKKLQLLAHPLQWEYVILPWRLKKKAPIAKFIEAHNGNKSIRSLRLQPQRAIMNAFRIGMKNAFDHLEALCNCLSSMQRLDTFSIFLDDQVDSRCYLPGPVLARIVHALPPSLLHLELDTACIDRINEDKPASDPADHLCLAISDHLPRLESLRLRLSCLCLSLFRSLSATNGAAKVSKLHRAFIRLDTTPDIERTLAVAEEVRDCDLPLDKRVYRTARGDHGPLTVKKISAQLLDLQAYGSFPELERFILWSWKSDFNRKNSYAHVRDIATRTIMRYPKLSIQQTQNLPEMHQGEYSVFMIRDHDREDYFGGRRMMESALLHEVNWQEGQDGIRQPPISKLKSATTRLHPDGLVSLEVAKAREAKAMREGGNPYLPNMEHFTRAKVLIEHM
jgi:hypothetical protein